MILSKMRDKTLSIAVKVAVNNYIKEYAEMLKFNLDSKSKSIEMEIMLEGERDTLMVNIEKYEITQEAEKYFIKIYNVKTSRKWIDTIASEYLNGRAFEIPASYAKMLQVVV